MKKCHICYNRIWPWQDQYWDKKLSHAMCHILTEVIPDLEVKVKTLNTLLEIEEKYRTLKMEPLRKTIPELEDRIIEQEDYRTLIVEPFREETTRIVQEMISNSPKIKKPSTKTTNKKKLKSPIKRKTKKSLTTKQLQEEATKILKKEKKKRK